MRGVIVDEQQLLAVGLPVYGRDGRLGSVVLLHMEPIVDAQERGVLEGAAAVLAACCAAPVICERVALVWWLQQ